MTASRTPQVTHYADEHTLARIRRLELALAGAKEALNDAAELITRDYCSHDKECGADNQRCYAREQYAALAAIEQLEKESQS